MFVHHCIFLFLSQLIRPSLQFELGATAFPDCKEKSWVCIVNERCHEPIVSSLWKFVTESDRGIDEAERLAQCEFLIRIRKLEDGKSLVVIKTTLYQIALVSSNGATEHFGCNRKQDQIEQIVSLDAMELMDIASSFDSATGRFTCAGYVLNTIPDLLTLEIKTSGANGAKEYTAKTGPAPDMSKYLSCDQFLVNAYAEVNQEYEEFSDVTNFVLPPNDTLPPDPCQPGNTLYYKEYFDSPSVPVHVSPDSFWCNTHSHKYELQLIGKGGFASPSDPFLLFCARNMNTQCLKPEKIPCEDCDELYYKEGAGLDPAVLTCKNNGFEVSNGGSESEVVPGFPVCKRRDETGAGWAIRPLHLKEKRDHFFTHATCGKKATCFGKQPLTLETECSEEEEDCSEARIDLDGVFCPNGTTIRYKEPGKDKWIDKNRSRIGCDSPPSWWPEEKDTVALYACFIDFSQAQMKGDTTAETQLIISFVLSLLASIVIVALFFYWRRLKRKDKEWIEEKKRAAESSKKDGGTRSEGVVTSESKKTDKEKTPLQLRMERYPGVEMAHLIRKDETKDLLFNDTLLGARADYISERFKKEFEFYSIYERTKFAETMAHDMGHRTYIAEFFEFFLSLIHKEAACGVWDNLVQGGKMLAFSIKRRLEDPETMLMLDHVKLVIFQFGEAYIPRVKSIPPTGVNEHQNISDIRALALYTKVFSLDQPTIDEMVRLNASMKDTVFPSLRRLIWSTAVRHDFKFEEMKGMLTKEVAEPSNEVDTRFGTKREHLVYALCSTSNRDLAEPFLNSLIKEPQYNGKDLVAAFTGMVKDHDDCHDCARFVFTERHRLIKEKIGVNSEEYKKILAILSQYASESLSNEGWLVKFLEAEETLTDAERKELKHEIKEAIFFRELYLYLPERIVDSDKKSGVNLKHTLNVVTRDFVLRPSVSSRKF